MAIISIPTSIGGVSIPGALASGPLASLINKATGGSQSQILQYPSDLMNSPSKGHAVFFTIKDVVPLSLTETSAFNLLSGSVNAAGTALGNAAGARTQTSGDILTKVKAGTSELVGSISGSFNSLKSVETIQSILKPKTTNILATIALYMPDTLSMSYSSDYEGFSLTSDLGAAGRIAQTGLDMAQAAKSGAGWDKVAKNLVNGPGSSELAGKALGALDVSNGADYLLKAAGYAVNPYRGVALREFQLDFLFSPKSQQEATTVNTIISTFKYHFLPDLRGAAGGDEGQYFTMPSIFNIQFKFVGADDTISSVISNVLGNLGPLGSAISPILPSGSGNQKENPYLFKVGDCVLESIDVDYAPNGWASHTDGAPVQTKLSLKFKEMDIMTRKSFDTGSVGPADPNGKPYTR